VRKKEGRQGNLGSLPNKRSLAGWVLASVPAEEPGKGGKAKRAPSREKRDRKKGEKCSDVASVSERGTHVPFFILIGKLLPFKGRSPYKNISVPPVVLFTVGW
jgi:hypothetical protein